MIELGSKKEVRFNPTVSTGDVIQAPASKARALRMYSQWILQVFDEKRKDERHGKSLGILPQVY